MLMPAPPPEQPRWLQALAAALQESLPRLHGCSGDSALIAELIAALCAALAEGELAVALPSQAHGEALLASPLAADPDGPLVLDGASVLFRRWHLLRRQVREALLRRAAQPLALPVGDLVALHGEGLDQQQRAAVAAMLSCPLVLLEGGPGTGKTSTVARMLAAVAQQQPGCRIQLAAPTGKAAARLREALGESGPPCTTLHRLLESRGERFGRDRRHPLDLDLLVVDEVSMVDLPLMAALLEALPLPCRLLLVGDRAQLPPVGPGSVLGDLQDPAVRQALGQGAVRLQRTYRNTGAIATVAAALRQGSTGLAPLLADLPADANLHWHRHAPQQLPPLLLERLRQRQQQLAGLAARVEGGSLPCRQALLAAVDQCLVLTPLRRGRWGVEAIHRALLGELAARPPHHWPVGTPVLCPLNLPDLGLANGDVGVVIAMGGETQLLFPLAGASDPLCIAAAQLPAAQPAFALTVHKAQGSEADEVWVLLPPSQRPQGSLLYTALTRARRQAWLITADLPTLEPDAAASLAPDR